ncbi:helix-turn-helix domain-containing protein [Massilia sp. IC2-477]|uniref:GlxA family transcriptional regulator n=1 Tax=Massilia sp. IC2-477 TaxID=2887198 RepID=UPI001D0F7F8F|nr:helix-turn-helix domain-containing protein [Massilia sp. IC2-477]MCC2954699.1 helix-turn-helix domain-containing protein [Massilia sp. IC2-477]
MKPPSLRIGLLLYPGCMPAGLLAFADLLHAANILAGRAQFETLFVGVDAGHVDCAHGLRLEAQAPLAAAGLDALLVPGFWAESAARVDAALADNPGLVEVIARLGKAVMVWSYCTGVVLAAAARRLDRQPATVTWWLGDAVRERFPRVDWQIERASVFNARSASASGVNGYLPIAQAFIEERLSIDAYRDLTRLMVLPRPGRTHQAFQGVSMIGQQGRLMQRLYQVAERMPATEATLARLAAELGTTERTLARKVGLAAAMPAASWVRRIKLNQVSERLIHTAAPASSISADLGFASDASMRRMFKELTGMTTAQYRQRFGMN